MESSKIVIPGTYILEGILETMVKDLGLTLERKEIQDTNLAYVTQGTNFKLSYQRWDTDDNLEDESLRLRKEDIRASFGTDHGKLDLIYEVDSSKLEIHRDRLAIISNGEEDLAIRLAIQKFLPAPKDKNKCYAIIAPKEHEILPFLKAQIEY